ncbi:MAG TPA: diguanylate cyclase [Rhodocyclaceae bacterium]|nr:diguanylate cyclase [Rhodocyclaceae bacterium]
MGLLSSKLRMSSWIRLGAITAVLLTTLILLGVIDHFAQRYARKEAAERLEQMAWEMRESLDRGIRERFVDISMLSTLPIIRPNGDPANIRKVLETLQDHLPYYAWIGLADTKGKVFAATHGVLEGKDVSGRPWFQNAQEYAYAGDYHPAVLLAKELPYQAEPWRFIDVAAPVFGADGKLHGVLGAHLSWRWAKDLAQRLFMPVQETYRMDVLIVRNDGTVLLGPKGLEEQKLDTFSVKRARAGQSGAVEEIWPDGRYVTGYTQTNPQNNYGLNWMILVRQPADVAMEAFDTLELKMLGVGIVIALILATLGAGLARQLSQPLAVLGSAAERRANGEDAEIPAIDDYREIAALSQTLSAMVTAEQQQRTALQNLNATLENQVENRTAELRLAADQLQTALLEQHAAKEELQRIVLLDVLTGLPNRRAFHDELPRAMARARRQQQTMAVLFLDLDGFKGVNDTYGHEAGDAVLREFAARISSSVRTTDMVARLAGDEFTVILEQLVADDDATRIAQKLLTLMQAPFALSNASVHLSSSIGIALFHSVDAVTPDQLVHAADQAMYAAKRAGKNQIQHA